MATFTSPPTVIFGENALESLAEQLSALGTHIFIVTDPGIVKAGIHDQVVQALQPAGLPITTYSDVVGNPTAGIVAAAEAARAEAGGDLIVAIGGGSSIDVAKSVALLATNGGKIEDYEGFEIQTEQSLPLAVVPTTVGSGSEVSRGAVITNEVTHVKMIIVSQLMFARFAVLDPRVVAGLPGMIAATTGMDALTHAIESYVSKGTNEFSGSIALGAIEIIGRSIVPASRGDKDALYEMLVASCMAGMAFHNSGLGAVHALANTLGGHFGVHHGTANALFLPYVIDFNIPAATARFARIASALGEDVAGLSEEDAAQRASVAVHRLAEETGVPRKLGDLGDLGIGEDTIEMLAKDALVQADLPGNPRDASLEDLIELYRKAL